MANQKITDLNKLTKLSNDDLFIVVDRDSKATSSSPTGETMGIDAETLAEQLAEVQAGNVGISFRSLSDVPDDYEPFREGYIRIKKDASGVEFTDSPGASEKSYPHDRFTTGREYRVGELLAVNSTGLFSHASSSNPASAEVVGIIKKLKWQDDNPLTEVITHINLVFNGLVEFPDAAPLFTDIEDPSDPSGVVNGSSLLVTGTTYFLGNNGSLADFDPAHSTAYENHVSKPVLIATGPRSGVMTNYRGFVCSSDEQSHKFVVTATEPCNSIEVGDILRIKRTDIRLEISDSSNNPKFSSDGGEPAQDEQSAGDLKPDYLATLGGTTDYVLANAISMGKATGQANHPVEDDNYGCDMIGIVINSTSDFFEIQTSGMIEFTPPVGVTSMFKQGYQYYLEAHDTSATAGIQHELRKSTYEFSETEIEQYNAGISEFVINMKTILNGERPFRNSTIVDPFHREYGSGGVVTAYSKPVFYAVGPNKILLTNRSAYPNPKDQCNAVDSTTGSPCIDRVETRNITITTPPPTNESERNIFENNYFSQAWPAASRNDVAIITFVTGENSFTTLTWKRIESGSTAHWQYQG